MSRIDKNIKKQKQCTACKTYKCSDILVFIFIMLCSVIGLFPCSKYPCFIRNIKSCKFLTFQTQSSSKVFVIFIKMLRRIQEWVILGQTKSIWN